MTDVTTAEPVGWLSANAMPLLALAVSLAVAVIAPVVSAWLEHKSRRSMTVFEKRWAPLNNLWKASNDAFGAVDAIKPVLDRVPADAEAAKLDFEARIACANASLDQFFAAAAAVQPVAPDPIPELALALGKIIRREIT